jgi:mono/diheme cytochrome c family protein
MPAFSQEQASTAKLEKVPIRESGEVSGSKLFHSYCASCHGQDGRGDGPAAPSLKSPPPDLRLLARKTGGKFPADHVLTILANEPDFPTHGSKEIPWGPIFRVGTDRKLGKLRAYNVTEYLKSIQLK